jgi:hypothetical protein
MYEALHFHNIILELDDQKHVLKGTRSRKEISKRLTKIERSRPKVSDTAGLNFQRLLRFPVKKMKFLPVNI